MLIFQARSHPAHLAAVAMPKLEAIARAHAQTLIDFMALGVAQ